MTAIVKNIKSVWSVFNMNAEGFVKVINELRQGWQEGEAYLREHPEARPVFYHN